MAGFHHQLSKVVQSIVGIQLVISIWRPNQGLINQQLQCPPILSTHAGSFFILEWLPVLKVLLEDIVLNFCPEVLSFLYQASPHNTDVTFQLKKKRS